MNCPVCGSVTRVADTRSDSEIVARKRKCILCHYVFYTTECEERDSKQEFNRLFRETLKRLENEKEKNSL